MIRRTLAATLLLTLALATTGLRAHDMFRFVGVVVKLDTAKNVLSFKTEEEKKMVTLEARLTKETTISRDGKPAARSLLRPGVNIVVDALGDDDGDLEVTAIKIVPPPGR